MTPVRLNLVSNFLLTVIMMGQVTLPQRNFRAGKYTGII